MPRERQSAETLPEPRSRAAAWSTARPAIAGAWLLVFAAAFAGLGLGGCAKMRARRAAEAAAAEPSSLSPWLLSSDPGLEVVAWSTECDEGTFGRALARYAHAGAAPGGLSPEAETVLASHGLRIMAVPIAELDALRIAIGVPPRHVNQWLGQAVVWTEAVSGPDMPRGQTVALDAERLRLGPGRLRLLARSWISPSPGSSRGMMTIELLPQHDEAGRPDAQTSLLAPKALAATDEGLLFTRLLTRMHVRTADTAYVLVGLPPGADLAEMARRAPIATEPQRASTDGEAGAAPGVGQVVRQPGAGSGAAPPAGNETSSAAEAATPGMGPAGPPAARAPTVGEAILSPPVWESPRRVPGERAPVDTRPVQKTPRRMVVVFVPRLPERMQLLP